MQDRLTAQAGQPPARKSDIPGLVAQITRLWARLHEADPALAMEVAAKLPNLLATRS